MTDTNKITERIRKLMEMTVGNGCSEAEALSAAQKAAALMREYNLTIDTVEISEKRTSSKTRGYGVIDDLWPVIAKCTNTSCIIETVGGLIWVKYIGKAPGPEIACYLREVCERAVKREVKIFHKSERYRRARSRRSRRRLSHDFTLALCFSLAQKLKILFSDQMCSEERERAIKVSEERLKPKKLKSRERSYSSEIAFQEGVSAADDINLAHAVNNGQAPRLIGGNA
ncbi:DUF2786 domain-containing protein [Pseudovibrio sp. Ad26]|uniref:DUF7168 domain-containing protein n=1 Tax=Pseudovibrio sp. Ad26 TaxID=989410 RepID=UPI0007AEBD9F|nr:DUF2786 domain-containing protein [Pseudovibrio sp. Ad26]KZL05541.1 hypothetical protein PsAD26_04338 [Pseudovibrio sp. Ad26]